MSRVSAADRIWLDLESTDNPITIIGVLEFAGPVEEGEVARLMRERVLEPHPRFASRVVRQGRHWRWERVADLNLAAHIHRVGLPAPGGQAALHRLVGQLMSTRLDPDRPLWQLHLVDLADGRSALVARLHHAIADGISLARVLLSLADMAEGEAWTNARTPSPWREKIRNAWRSWRRYGGFSQVVDGAERVSRAAVDLAVLPPEPASLFRGELGTHKVVAWTEAWDVAEVKAVARAMSATINDVVLATLAGALRRYLLEHGEDPVPLRTFVPVNLRRLDRPLPRDLGNQFGLVIVDLPVAAHHPRQALEAVCATMRQIKRSPSPVVTFAALQVLGAVPDPLTHAGVGWFGRTASSITTNVPGPRQPITLAGVEVEGMMFWVPQSAKVGLGISIFSYAGKIRVGVASDACRVPDPSRVVAHWNRSFEELRACALDEGLSPGAPVGEATR